MTSDVAKGPSRYDELNDETWLREKYVDEDATICEIADIVGCGQTTVNRHLARHGIERDPDAKQVDNRLLDAEWLREEYVENHRSAGDIADELGYTRKHVVKWLRRHGIDVRSGGETTWYPELADATFLKRQYVDEGYSLKQVADEIGCSPKGVHNALIRHCIITPDSSLAPPEQGVDHCPFHTNTDGYEVWTARGESGGSSTVFVHQLLAVARGASPEEVFGGGYHCHHRNSIGWDNRPENLEVLTHGEHSTRHNNQRWSDSA